MSSFDGECLIILVSNVQRIDFVAFDRQRFWIKLHTSSFQI